MKEILAILTSARTLLTPPGTWIRKKSAEDRDGNWVPPLDPRACKWCLIGALRRVTPPGDLFASHDAADELRRLLGDASPALWNDQPGRTQAEVLALLDRAIAEVKS